MAATIAALLDEARAAGVDRLDAQLLVAHRLARPRGWLLANDEVPVDPAMLDALRADFARRADGVPLAYLTGHKEFHGLDLRVNGDVLVPRPDTETLVDWAIGIAATMAAPAVVDLGTGSGAIALALKAACPHACVVATDASAEALAVARGNAARLGIDLTFARGDWWLAVQGRYFDLALSNPPYVALGDPHLASLRHEPAQALIAGADGLLDLRAIVAASASRLHPGGRLLLEHGHDQAAAVAALLDAHGFTEVETRRDLAGLPRVSGGRRR